MTEDIVIQTTYTENGHGQRIVPIYFTSFHVPLELYNDEAMNRKASSLVSFAQNAGCESSFVRHFTNTNYGREMFYVSSPDRSHTGTITEAILNGFGISYVLR